MNNLRGIVTLIFRIPHKTPSKNYQNSQFVKKFQ